MEMEIYLQMFEYSFIYQRNICRMIQSELICGGEDQTQGPISLGYRRERIVPSGKSKKEKKVGNGEKI